jgi:hypothetical protein
VRVLITTDADAGHVPQSLFDNRGSLVYPVASRM